MRGIIAVTLKDLLVHVDDSRQCPARLDATVTLTAAHDAHLVGIYVVAQPRLPTHIRAQIPDDLLLAQQKREDESVARVRAAFEDAVRRAGVNGEWRSVDGSALPTLALHGRYVDLLVVGQRDPSGETGADDPSIPDHLILSAGRPALVIPYTGQFPVVGERVMVAWDASRLAARAVNDALPLMARAKSVVVLAVNPVVRDDERGHGDIPCADICLHLARHGIRAEAQQIYADDLDVGEMLLSRAADQGIDLMVCGAYGHARWREVVLGGVTRHLLAHMTLPVLMSH